MNEGKEQGNEMEVEENGTAEVSNAEVVIAPMDVTSQATGSSDEANASATQNAVKVMASSGTVGSVSVGLHPLVIMNVSEHWTRLRAQEGTDQLGNSLIFILMQVFFCIYLFYYLICM